MWKVAIFIFSLIICIIYFHEDRKKKQGKSDLVVVTQLLMTLQLRQLCPAGILPTRDTYCLMLVHAVLALIGP